MKIPGWWRIRHLYNDTKKITKNGIDKIGRYVSSLNIQQKRKHIVRKVELPSRKELEKIKSRKELLAIAHKHDLISFYINYKS